MDEPKSMRSIEAREQRLAQLEEGHIAPLTDFVKRLRQRWAVNT
ncbi:hypothetical protein [Bordetella sp. 02P26C-1]|nr:hypothetical protein [Bordetella sp. 02P26C-1]